MKSRFPFAVMLALVPALAGCAGKAPQPAVTPVIASDIDRQSFTGTCVATSTLPIRVSAAL